MRSDLNFQTIINYFKSTGKFPVDKEDYYYIYQNEEELNEYISYLSFMGKNIQNGLEIGFGNGGTFYVLSKLANLDANLISIDLDVFNEDDYRRFIRYEQKEILMNEFKKPNQVIHSICKDSHSDECLKEVIEILGEEKLDYLMIDGDHLEDGMRKDFNFYSRFVRKDGLIILHDILNKHFPDCLNFWEELKTGYKYKEIGISLNKQKPVELYTFSETPIGIGIIIQK